MIEFILTSQKLDPDMMHTRFKILDFHQYQQRSSTFTGPKKYIVLHLLRTFQCTYWTSYLTSLRTSMVCIRRVT